MKAYIVWYDPICDCGHRNLQGVYTSRTLAFIDFPQLIDRHGWYEIEEIELNRKQEDW